MSYERFIARKRKRIPYRSSTTAVGEALPTLALPLNARKHEHGDVAYEGAPDIEIPFGENRTVRDRSGNKKRY